MTQIIGFSGRKFSGKNTCADQMEGLILAHSPSLFPRIANHVRLYAFADPMKRVCQQFFGLTRNQCYGSNTEKNTPTILQWGDFPVHIPDKAGYMTAREVLQFFGTEVIRAMEANAHVRALMWDIEHDHPEFALVTDVRFPNEVDAIRERGGKVIRLTRALYGEDNHPSESSLDPERYDWDNFDFVLDNANMNLEEQRQNLRTLVELWGLHITGAEV